MFVLSWLAHVLRYPSAPAHHMSLSHALLITLTCVLLVFFLSSFHPMVFILGFVPRLDPMFMLIVFFLLFICVSHLSPTAISVTNDPVCLSLYFSGFTLYSYFPLLSSDRRLYRVVLMFYNSYCKNLIWILTFRLFTSQ